MISLLRAIRPAWSARVCRNLSNVVQQTRAPEVYTVVPPQLAEKKPGQLSSREVEQYFEDGYVVVPSFFTEAEMSPAVKGVEECVDIIADKLYRGGKITDKCEKAGFYERLTLLEQQFKGTAVMLHKQGHLPLGIRQLWANKRLLNIVEQFIGPNIAGHPVWNLRTKTPHNEQTTVPWHQDNAYFDDSALRTLVATAWIPLIDTNVINGCLQVIKGGHRLGMTATHTCCAGGTWYVDLDESEMVRSMGVNMERDVVTCEVPMGGILFFNNCIPHRSLENYSDKIRWSLDLRWQDPAKPTGLWDLKGTVLMRSTAHPDLNEIEWEEFVSQDRNKLQAKSVGHEEDEFDTTIHGPWMKRWKITNHNRHTHSLSRSEQS